jgi:hypothetical protein
MIISRIFAVASLVAVAGLTVASNAAAVENMSVSGASGNSYWPGDATCFGNDGSDGVTNACSGASRTYVVHIPNHYVGATSAFNSIVGVEVSGSSTCAYYEWASASPAAPALVSSGSLGSGSVQTWSPVVISHFTWIEVRCNVPSGSGVRTAWAVIQ